MPAIRNLIFIGCVLQLSACLAPITPPPGPQSSLPSIPSSSSGGSPSPMPPSTPSPGGTPPSLPSPSGSPGTPSPPSSGSESGSGTPTSYESDGPAGAPSPGGGVPGDESGPDGQPAWETTEGGGSPSDESSEEGQPGGGSPSEESWEQAQPGGGDDGWQDSNQVPGEPADMPPMPSERGGAAGAAGDSSNPGGDGELDEALEVFDGEILAEREVIRTRANEVSEGAVLPIPEAESSGTDDSQPKSRGGSVSMPTNRNPAPTPGASGPVPEDIPDAKDDDIIARQLREAANQESDPILKEKLWDEYRRYRRG